MLEHLRVAVRRVDGGGHCIIGTDERDIARAQAVVLVTPATYGKWRRQIAEYVETEGEIAVAVARQSAAIQAHADDLFEVVRALAAGGAVSVSAAAHLVEIILLEAAE